MKTDSCSLPEHMFWPFIFPRAKRQGEEPQNAHKDFYNWGD